MTKQEPKKATNAATEVTQLEKRGKRGRPRGKGTQIVYDTLRKEILTLGAKPGDHLDETLLEKRFRVSRTPIREALIRLQADRLVHFSANRGHFVELINFDDIPRMFEALDLYQAAALRLAAARRNESHLEQLNSANDDYWAAAEAGDHRGMTEANHQFHLVVGKAADNKFIGESYSNVLNYSLRLAYLMFENAERLSELHQSYYEQVFSEHKQMINLIRQRDADALEDISRQHTRLFCGRVSASLADRLPLRSKPQDFY